MCCNGGYVWYMSYKWKRRKKRRYFTTFLQHIVSTAEQIYSSTTQRLLSVMFSVTWYYAYYLFLVFSHSREFILQLTLCLTWQINCIWTYKVNAFILRGQGSITKLKLKCFPKNDEYIFLAAREVLTLFWSCIALCIENKIIKKLIMYQITDYTTNA